MSTEKTPHQHRHQIIAWAEGLTIQRSKGGRDWRDDDWPTWDEDTLYRVKPEPPAKVYPETQLCTYALYEIWTRPAVPIGSLTNVANAALRHAIDAGQVVTMDEHTSEMSRACMLGQDRSAARDMAIAEEVRNAVIHAFERTALPINSYGTVYGIDLTAIIAKVPA